MKKDAVQVHIYNQDPSFVDGVRKSLQSSGLDVQLVNIQGVDAPEPVVVKSACAEHRLPWIPDASALRQLVEASVCSVDGE